MRLGKYQAETRDLTTTATAGGGFVPPQYLGELFAALPRASRPFADVVPTRPLPATGMAITIPRITTGTSVAVMTSENASVNEVDIVEATISVPVRTIAGQQDVSQQLLDRTDPSIDSIIFQDLRNAYDASLDTQLLAGTGSSGQALGIRAVSSVNTVSYTDGSPTAAELVPKIYDAIQKVETTRYQPADTIVMHPRRAAWLASNLSSTFPLFQLGSLVQAAGTQDNGMLRSFSGLRVVLDASIGSTYGAGTNEDEIYVLRAADLILMEGPLQARVLSEVLSGTLTVRIQLFGYVAFASAGSRRASRSSRAPASSPRRSRKGARKLMAKFVLTNASVSVNGVDLSDHVQSVTVETTRDDVEVTAMGATYKSYLGGLGDANITGDVLLRTSPRRLFTRRSTRCRRRRRRSR
jgi:hypothetical protein